MKTIQACYQIIGKKIPNDMYITILINNISINNFFPEPVINFNLFFICKKIFNYIDLYD